MWDFVVPPMSAALRAWPAESSQRSAWLQVPTGLANEATVRGCFVFLSSDRVARAINHRIRVLLRMRLVSVRCVVRSLVVRVGCSAKDEAAIQGRSVRNIRKDLNVAFRDRRSGIRSTGDTATKDLRKSLVASVRTGRTRRDRPRQVSVATVDRILARPDWTTELDCYFP